MMILLFVPIQTHAWDKPTVKKDGWSRERSSRLQLIVKTFKSISPH